MMPAFMVLSPDDDIEDYVITRNFKLLSDMVGYNRVTALLHT